MYTDYQPFLTPTLRWLRTGSFVLGLLQLAAMAAAETSMTWPAFDFRLHIILLALTGLVCGLLWSAGLAVRATASGLAIRFWPYHRRFQEVRWSEIRRLRILGAGELPAGARFGSPGRDFSHSYWLTRPELPVLCIELVNGDQLYVSSAQPAALMDFLHHGLLAIGRFGVKT